MLLRKPFLKTFHCLWILQASQVEKIEELWDPKLKIQNLEEIKGGRDEKWHTIKLGEVDPVVVYRRRLKGSFYENMELKDFPRDVQVKKDYCGFCDSQRIYERLSSLSVSLISPHSRLS